MWPGTQRSSRPAMSADPSSQHANIMSTEAGDSSAHSWVPTSPRSNTRPSITDPYADVLEVLSPQERCGLVAQLAVGFYDGWRPGRSEVIDLVAVRFGILSIDECERRRRLRNNGHAIPDIDVISEAHDPDLRLPHRSLRRPLQRDDRGQWTTHDESVRSPNPEAPHREGQS